MPPKMSDPLALKTDPKYGCFLRWPQDGNDWVHPDDVATARAMIPSGRVFRRDGTEGKFHCLQYGGVTLRVLPALWQEVAHEDFDIGDLVEVLSRGMRNEPRTGIIREMLWDYRDRAIRYQIAENDVPIADLYARGDLQHVEQVQDK
jgi:hypothetical protein